MELNPYETLFEQRHVVAITGVKASTLQNWANRHIIPLKQQSPGKTGKRVYSAVDIYRVAFLVTMGRLGLNPFDSGRFFGYLENQIKNAYKKHDWDFDKWDYQMCLFIYPDPSKEGSHLSLECYWSLKTGYLTATQDKEGDTERPVDISIFENAIFFRSNAFLANIHHKIQGVLASNEYTKPIRSLRLVRRTIKKIKPCGG